MLVEQVVEVDLTKNLRFQVLVDGLGIQFVFKDAHLHQEERYHPLLHQDLKSTADPLLRALLKQFSQAFICQ